jgi:hypothetical protein
MEVVPLHFKPVFLHSIFLFHTSLSSVFLRYFLCAGALFVQVRLVSLQILVMVRVERAVFVSRAEELCKAAQHTGRSVWFTFKSCMCCGKTIAQLMLCVPSGSSLPSSIHPSIFLSFFLSFCHKLCTLSTWCNLSPGINIMILTFVCFHVGGFVYRSWRSHYFKGEEDG